MTAVFLNGSFYTDHTPGASLPDARVSAFDAGFQHGVGLFETMLGGVRDADTTPKSDGQNGASLSAAKPVGWCYRLEAHMERLRDSALALGLSDTINPAALGEAVLQTIEHSKLPKARVRLTITAGDLNMLARGSPGGGVPGRANDPTIMIVAQPATEYPAPMFDRGVSVVIADPRANPLNPFESHKTLNYWWRLNALQAAAARGAGESIVLQVSNHLASGCVSNVFVVKNDTLLTPIARGEEPATGSSRPALPSPVLPGVSRAAIRELAGSLGLECHTEMLSVQELVDADEVFLTNSSWGVLPVVSVIGLGEPRAIGSGAPGSITKDLRQRWLADVEHAKLA
jgi:branched-chain amino acid aminotransferase